MVNDYSEFIEYLLNGKCKPRGKYYICCNPLIPEVNPSCQFFTDGWMKMYNGNINGKAQIHIKEVSIMLGYYDDYLQWIMQQYSIPLWKLNKIRELHKETIKSKEYKKLKQEFYELVTSEFISFKDILEGNYMKQKKITPKKKHEHKVEQYEEQPNEEELHIIQSYAYSRMIELQGMFSPIVVCNDYYEAGKYVKTYKSPAIRIEYSLDFCKYRLIGNEKFRYITKGVLKELCWFVNEDCHTLLIVEGAIEAYSLSKVINHVCDIAGMDSTSTLITQHDLREYDKVIVIIDSDKYFKSVPILKNKLKDCNYVIVSKYLYNEQEDFNKHLTKDENNFKIYIDKMYEIWYNVL